MAEPDCRRCGACCANSDENRREDYPWYVPIDDRRSRLLTDPALRKRYVAIDGDGVPHLRLDPHHRCTALRGRLGEEVTCRVYADRPACCRAVQPGDEACTRARRERGLDP